MSILSGLNAWMKDKEEYYAGCLYKQDIFLSIGWLKRFYPRSSLPIIMSNR